MDLGPGLAQEPVEGMEVEGRVEEEEGPETTTAMKSELSVYL